MSQQTYVPNPDDPEAVVEQYPGQGFFHEHNPRIARSENAVREVFDVRKYALEVLEEISLGKGRYSLDHHQHAKNTIEEMKQLALEAIEKIKTCGGETNHDDVQAAAAGDK